MRRSLTVTWINGLLVATVAACISCNPGASPTINSRSTSGGQDSDSYSYDVLARVRQIVAEALRLKPEEVNVDAPLSRQKNPGDEHNVVEIIMMVEEAYKIEIKDEELGVTLDHVAGTLTVRKLADIVIRKKRINS